MRTAGLIILAVLALALGSTYASIGERETLAVYLWGVEFVLGIAVGSLALLSMHRLTGGAWGIAAGPLWRAAVGTLPIVLLLLLPLILNPGPLYPWLAPPQALSTKLQQKSAYLTWSFFAWRAAIYWLFWFVWAWALHRPRWGRSQAVAGLGLIGFFFTVTFSSFDWIMSLEPEWYSTIYGLYLMVSWILSAITFAVGWMSITALRNGGPGILAERTLRWDFANFILTFICFWGYAVVSQLIIVWSENLPDEVGWYVRRVADGWLWFYLAVVAIHAACFLVLLHRGLKQRLLVLAGISAALLLARLGELYWLILPGAGRTTPLLGIRDAGALAGILLIWGAAAWLIHRARVRLYQPAPAILLLALAVLPSAAHATRDPAAVAEEVGVKERLGQDIDLDRRFVTQDGEQRSLRELIPPGKPFIITPVYFRCPQLCPLLLQGTAELVNDMPLTLGRDYAVLSITMSSEEGLDDAKQAATKYTGMLHSQPAQGWYFLTGKMEDIHAIMQDIGFRYVPDEANYMHSAVVVVLGGNGVISRYRYGAGFDPETIRLSLVEAARGQVGRTVDKVILYCFHYDASKGRYTATVMNIVRIISGALVAALALGILVTWRLRRREPDGARTSRPLK